MTPKTPSTMKPIQWILAIVGILIAGFVLGRLTGNAHDTSDQTEATPNGDAPSEYTCSMHPQIRQPNPGTCPICAMDLIPAGRADREDSAPREVSLTQHAKALARIQTTEVERRIPDAEIRLFGRVQTDETRLRSITARFPARIERLFVNFTGVRVEAGDHLAKVYSPELLTAQAELLSALRFEDPRAIRSSREKLALWGLTERAIAAIESSGEPSDTMEITSPLGGFVTRKLVNDGDYVQTGALLFTIADLSTVWVVLDAYEMDMPWLRFGQPVTFTVEALPGRTFEGIVSFIPPVLDPETRTFKVRVNVPNADLALRPGMFVTGLVHARIAGEGVVLDPSLEGKWISPMHPEIIKDGPGECDVCGMDLVPATELGYAISVDAEAPVLVPASAVLQTGRRAIVYVEKPESERPTYEGREIVLGPRAGDAYLVASGLEAGERVVTNGAFKIDSALQLLAKPSMMSAPDPDQPPEIEASPAMRSALATLSQNYFPVWRALAADDLPAARSAAEAMEAATHAWHGQSGTDSAKAYFEEMLARLSKSAGSLAGAGDIDTARVQFELLSNTLIEAVRAVGLPADQLVYLAFCPMAFEGRRADWLQDDKPLLNPYFGSAMLRCGEFEELSIPRAAATPAPPPAGHQH